MKNSADQGGCYPPRPPRSAEFFISCGCSITVSVVALCYIYNVWLFI